MNKTILVTGGAGYIGSFTVRELIKNGYEVVVFDSLENGHKEAIDPRAKLVVGELANKKDIEQVFNEFKIDAVIDFAAYLNVGESMENPEKYMKNNVENFVSLLEIMASRGCKYIIKSSTAATYGDPLREEDFPLKERYHDSYKPTESAMLPGKWKGVDVTGEVFFQKIISYYSQIFTDREDIALNQANLTKLRIPTSIYGLTKLLDEIILEKYNQTSGMKSVALRYFNVCGGAIDGSMGDDKLIPTNLTTLTILNVLGKTGPLKVFGNDYPTKDGTGIRDYIHPLDLASGHLAALKYLINGGSSEIFNLGNGTGYSVFDVIKATEHASGKKVSYEIVARRSGDVIISTADQRKANTMLDWESKYNLDDMACSAWLWQSKHPNGYRSVG